MAETSEVVVNCSPRDRANVSDLMCSGGYDWSLEWRGVLTDGLAKLLRTQSNDALVADPEALDHVEGLLLNLLALLIKRPSPVTMAHVEVTSD